MRVVTYDTQEERDRICTAAHATGEQLYHDNLVEGVRTLVFDAPQPDWVRYFQTIMPDGQATRGTPLDMTAARAFHMDKVRAVRDAALVELDVPFMRAVEVDDGAAQTRIAAQKQALRDIPQTIQSLLDAAATPEGVMAVWAAGLARPT